MAGAVLSADLSGQDEVSHSTENTEQMPCHNEADDEKDTMTGMSCCGGECACLASGCVLVTFNSERIVSPTACLSGYSHYQFSLALSERTLLYRPPILA